MQFLQPTLGKASESPAVHDEPSETPGYTHSWNESYLKVTPASWCNMLSQDGQNHQSEVLEDIRKIPRVRRHQSL